jgi:hypothetical protein
MQTKLAKNPADLGSYYLALAGIAFICISWPFIILRLYVRIFRVRSLGRDDITALLSQVSQYSTFSHLIYYELTRESVSDLLHSLLCFGHPPGSKCI